MNKKKINNKIVIYQAPGGGIGLRGDVTQETIWASQAQIAEVFDVERSVITKHIRNILKDKELDKNQVSANFAHTAEDGKTYQVQFYTLDVILAVGYRTNSFRAIDFRKWATKTLRQHLIKGYTINKKRIAKNYDSFMQAVETVRGLLPAESKVDTESILELIKTFADTWFSLDAYDKGRFAKGKVTKKKIELAAGDLAAGIAELKVRLIKKGEASELFATECDRGLKGIVGSIHQTFDGKEVYPSVEEKVAHLLYFLLSKIIHWLTETKELLLFFLFCFFRKIITYIEKEIGRAHV